jgi:hypothetical protein
MYKTSSLGLPILGTCSGRRHFLLGQARVLILGVVRFLRQASYYKLSAARDEKQNSVRLIRLHASTLASAARCLFKSSCLNVRGAGSALFYRARPMPHIRRSQRRARDRAGGQLVSGGQTSVFGIQAAFAEPGGGGAAPHHIPFMTCPHFSFSRLQSHLRPLCARPVPAQRLGIPLPCDIRLTVVGPELDFVHQVVRFQTTSPFWVLSRHECGGGQWDVWA